MNDGGTLGESARRDFASLCAAQISAIGRYLWWVLDRDGHHPLVEQALEKYWLAREAQARHS
jgi:hypothetical protein